MGCALFSLALFGLLWLIPNNTSPAQSELDIAPGLIPALASLVILVLGLFLAIHSYLAQRKGHESDEMDHDEFQGEVTGLGWRELTNLLLWTAFSVAGILGFKYVGFHVTAGLMLAGAMVYAGCRRIVTVAITAVVSPLVISQIVWHAFTIRLP